VACDELPRAFFDTDERSGSWSLLPHLRDDLGHNRMAASVTLP